ncbi:hypothetical protein PS706_03310 [Pseudomonas fluorescens]|nr:hypothetical protein PS706_03310 [Pseudomonas fluorescens]
MGLQDTAVSRLGVGACHQTQRPRLSTFSQHRRDRPYLAGGAGNADAQLHRRRPVGQLHIGAGGDQPAFWQGLVAAEQYAVIGQRCTVHGGQRHPFRPGHGLQAGALGQQHAGAQLCARHQGLRLAEQGAGGEQQVTAAIAHIGRQHAASGQHQVLGQCRDDRQARAGSHRQAFDRQVVVKRGSGREGGAVRQGHTVARHHDIPTTEIDTRQQHPAFVILGHRRLGEAVVDAAVDIQVAAGAQGQAAGLAGTINRVVLLTIGVEAGIAVAGQVQITLHHQIAVRGLADDFHARTQMEGIGISGVVQPGELVVQQVQVALRRIDKRLAQGVLAIQVTLGDLLIRSAAGGRVGFFRRIVVGGHAVEGYRACALDNQAPAGIDIDVIAAAVRVEQPRRVQRQGAAIAPIVARRAVGAMAQVDAHAIGQGQLAGARPQYHTGAVRRVDDLAVAVHPQLAAMGVEYRRAVQGQAIFAGQVDAADPLAAGVHQTFDAQAAIVHRHTDGAGLEPVADGQVTLLELETARTEDFAVVEALVEVGELLVEGAAAAQALRLDFHGAGQVRY